VLYVCSTGKVGQRVRFRLQVLSYPASSIFCAVAGVGPMQLAFPPLDQSVSRPAHCTLDKAPRETQEAQLDNGINETMGWSLQNDRAKR
jgi:hypothetical protein